MVIDEEERMLEMGLINDVKRIEKEKKEERKKEML